MRLSQRQLYHRESFIGTSYYYVMFTIASFIGGSLKGKSRKHIIKASPVTSCISGYNTNYIENVYLIRTENFISKYILISYLIKFPLLSYKYSSIGVFISLLRISLGKKEGIKETELELITLKYNLRTYIESNHDNHIRKNHLPPF